MIATKKISGGAMKCIKIKKKKKKGMTKELKHQMTKIFSRRSQPLSPRTSENKPKYAPKQRKKLKNYVP